MRGFSGERTAGENGVCYPSPGMTLSSKLHLSAQSESRGRNHRIHALRSHPPFWPSTGFLSRTQNLVWLRAIPFLKQLLPKWKARPVHVILRPAGLLSPRPPLDFPSTPASPCGERQLTSDTHQLLGTYLLALFVLNAVHVLTPETLPVTLRDHHPFLILQTGRQRPTEEK